MKIKIILFTIIISFFACKKVDPNKQIDEGSVTENIYTSKEIGWTMEIPKGWDVTTKDILQERTEKGMKAIENAVEQEYDYSGLKHLIGFQKDKFHIFQSTSEAFKLEYEGEWEENNKALKNLLYETFTNQGIKVDTTSSTEKIDNLNFEVFHITLYGPNGNIILYQDMYSRYINGYDFGVNLNYINDKEKNEMMTVWKKSKFSN